MARKFKIGLAVSGGADSVALLVFMAAQRDAAGDDAAFEAVVLHVDHGLRPDSAADARFVEDLAAAHGFPFQATRVRIRRRRGESLEMAARRVRLAFFARMTRALGLDAIATGHHADDVAETFLLRLARGAGPDGLAGLKPLSRVGPLTFIRPFLNARDADLRAYLAARRIPWREDSTNADTTIRRNNVRHVILPFLRAHLDPRITEHICKSAAILRGDLTRTAPSGARAGRRATDDAAPAPTRYQLTVEAAAGFVRRGGETIGALPATCELSRAALAGRTLEMRVWRPGDRIAPVGMGGHGRKLQDVFVTAKVPRAIRAALPVLTDAATGDILWLPGYRVAAAAAVETAAAPSWRFTLSACAPVTPRRRRGR